MQKYIRIYDYIHEYQQLIYDFYSKNANAFLCTYYNVDSVNTVWDNTDVMDGIASPAKFVR